MEVCNDNSSSMDDDFETVVKKQDVPFEKKEMYRLFCTQPSFWKNPGNIMYTNNNNVFQNRMKSIMGMVLEVFDED